MTTHPIKVILLFLFLSITTKAQHIMLLQQGKPTSIRGLSVVNDKIAWVSGSKGYVSITKDGGQTWAWQQVKGYENADFRSIEAFSDKEAVIMSSGTPALILKTVDGGTSWQLKYRNADTTYFLDAMQFNDIKHGFVLGDPINNKFMMLETSNGGENWTAYNNSPTALTGEAAFAASGTCLRALPDHKLYIVTGGPLAEADITKPNDEWHHHRIPIYNGQASKGAFSIAVNSNQLVVVGGDFQHDKFKDSTACYSIDGGSFWHLSEVPPSGYQSCVEYIDRSIFLSTGTPGSNLTTDGGKTWLKIDNTSFNVCRRAKHGKLVLLAGNDGRIAIYKP